MAFEQSFDADTLPQLRRAVRGVAVAAGVPGDQVDDVVLAVHELAANAVRHGGGSGHLRMDTADGELRCRLSDAGQGGASARVRTGVKAATWQWLILPGHGLALVRDIADNLSIASALTGSEVTAVFTLPGFRNDPDAR
jgi:anti-sigma regulatory factor (Ser/Thr protein kinase)